MVIGKNEQRLEIELVSVDYCRIRLVSYLVEHHVFFPLFILQILKFIDVKFEGLDVRLEIVMRD